MRNTAAAKQRNQRLEDLMLFDPHVKYAKSIGVEDTKIRYALLNQMGKNHCNFSNCQELLNAVLNLKKDDKCLKCKNAEKKCSMHAMWAHGALLDMRSSHLLLLVMFPMDL